MSVRSVVTSVSPSIFDFRALSPEYFGADVLEPITTPTDAGVFVAFADPVVSTIPGVPDTARVTLAGHAERLEVRDAVVLGRRPLGRAGRCPAARGDLRGDR